MRCRTLAIGIFEDSRKADIVQENKMKAAEYAESTERCFGEECPTSCTSECSLRSLFVQAAPRLDPIVPKGIAVEG